MEQKPQWMSEHEKSDRLAFKELNDKLDQHMRELQPYIQGAAGLGLLWKLLIGLGGAVLLYAQIKAIFWPH